MNFAKLPIARWLFAVGRLVASSNSMGMVGTIKRPRRTGCDSLLKALSLRRASQARESLAAIACSAGIGASTTVSSSPSPSLSASATPSESQNRPGLPPNSGPHLLCPESHLDRYRGQGSRLRLQSSLYSGWRDSYHQPDNAISVHIR